MIVSTVLKGHKDLRAMFNTDVSCMKDLKDNLPIVNARLYRKLLVKKLKEQDFPGANIPLDSKYLRRKQSRGADRRILISTGEYLKHIKVLKIRGENRYFVGPSPYTKVPGTQLTYEDLGIILESKRPHLMATFKRTRRKRDLNWKLIYNVYA